MVFSWSSASTHGLLTGFCRPRNSGAEAASASAGAAALPASPGVPVTSGGGVVCRGPAPEALNPKIFGAGVGKRQHKVGLNSGDRPSESSSLNPKPSWYAGPGGSWGRGTP